MSQRRGVGRGAGVGLGVGVGGGLGSRSFRQTPSPPRRNWSVTPATFEAFAADAPASTIKSILHENSDHWRRRS